jgi:uncharacterized protein
MTISILRPVPKALVIFMRYPEIGKVKSRLASSIGGEEAARVYEKLLRSTLGIVSDFKRERPEVAVYIYFTPQDKRDLIERSYSGPWQFLPQGDGNIGEKMCHAVQSLMSCGHQHVLVVGTDIIDLSTSDFHEAFDALDRGCAALGPAADGGFYLIGLDRPCPSVFDSDKWGTNDVYARTERLLRSEGFRLHTVRQRNDVDRAKDLERMRGDPVLESRISIIIPTLSEAQDLLPRLLVPLQDMLWPEDEIIVVRGTPGIQQEMTEPGPRIRCVSSPVGRGEQLNRGASVAEGNVFLFLHDDCMPPPHFCHTVRKIVSVPRMSLGCFHLAFSPSSSPMDMIAAWANFRTRAFKLPYGDQGLFCRREVFEKMGGFKKRYLMEDVDLVKRSRRWGDLLICAEEVVASPQRYLSRGILRTSMLNHLIMLLYHLGVEDRRLYSLYYRK